MSGKLPLSVNLVQGETPASFAVRLGRKNGSEYAADFCLDRGFRLQDVADGRAHALSSLAVLGGESLTNLKRFSVERIGETQYSVAGQRLEKRWIQRSRLRFCPRCVAEDLSDPSLHGSALRAHWHVPFIRTCQKHQVSISEIDSVCHTRGPHDFTGRLKDLGIRHEKLTQNCGQRTPSTLEAYLTGRMDGFLREPWLDGLPFNAVAMASEALGLMLAFGRDRKIGALSPRERIEAGAAGFRVVRDGEEAIRACLASRHQRGGAPTWFQRQFYGYFFLWLEASHSELYEPIRKIMRDHIAQTYPVEDGEVILGEACKRRRVYSIRTLKEATGIEPKKLKHILHHHGLLGRDERTGKFEGGVVFSAEDVDPIVARFKGSVCQLAARRRINAPRAQFDVLLKAGIIQPIGGAGDARPSYDPERLDDFLTSLQETSTPVDADNEHCVDIQTACRKTVTGAAEIVDLILSKRLKFVGQRLGQKGYLSLRVDPREIAEQMRLAAPKGYMKPELRTLLGVNDPAIRYLADIGLLSTIKSRHPISRKAISIVTYDAMDAFLSKYVPVKLMSEVWGIHIRTVGYGLLKRGATLLPMPKECSGRIFLRHDLQRVTDRQIPDAKSAMEIFSKWAKIEGVGNFRPQ